LSIELKIHKVVLSKNGDDFRAMISFWFGGHRHDEIIFLDKIERNTMEYGSSLVPPAGSWDIYQAVDCCKYCQGSKLFDAADGQKPCGFCDGSGVKQ
jgi:hypothetical protein